MFYCGSMRQKSQVRAVCYMLQRERTTKLYQKKSVRLVEREGTAVGRAIPGASP